jgi:hypothetical protein
MSADSAEVQLRKKLRLILMGFADTFISSVAEKGLELETQGLSQSQRRNITRTVLTSYAAVIDIASEVDIGTALLDMVVLVTLERIVWEEFWQPKVYGDLGIPMLNAFKRLEEEIWRVSDDYLTPQQQNELLALIQEWRAKNPEIKKVDFVRFSSFGTLEEKPSLARARQRGGLLAPLTETAKAMDEMRMTIERTLFRLSRGQLMVNIQALLLFVHLEATGDRLVSTAMNRISTEREAAFNQLMERFAQERKNALGNLREELERAQDMLPQLKETIQEINTAFQSAEKLLVSPAWRENLPLIANAADKAKRETEKLLNHTFFVGVGLILVFFLALFLTLIGYLYISKRFKR